ncbi:hypothetical protein U1Q18_048755, partial [Sarracenia purpurea var. burkii]
MVDFFQLLCVTMVVFYQAFWWGRIEINTDQVMGQGCCCGRLKCKVRRQPPEGLGVGLGSGLGFGLDGQVPQALAKAEKRRRLSKEGGLVLEMAQVDPGFWKLRNSWWLEDLKWRRWILWEFKIRFLGFWKFMEVPQICSYFG